MTEKLRGWRHSLSHADRKDFALWAMMVLLIVFIVGGLYQIYWPVEPIRIDKIDVSDSVLERGHCAWFQFQGEKFLPITAHVSVELSDGVNYSLMSYDADNKVGTNFKKRSFIVPAYVVPGKYKIKWSGTYNINPLKTKKYVAYSEEITIR